MMEIQWKYSNSTVFACISKLRALVDKILSIFVFVSHSLLKSTYDEDLRHDLQIGKLAKSAVYQILILPIV